MTIIVGENREGTIGIIVGKNRECMVGIIVGKNREGMVGICTLKYKNEMCVLVLTFHRPQSKYQITTNVILTNFSHDFSFNFYEDFLCFFTWERSRVFINMEHLFC